METTFLWLSAFCPLFHLILLIVVVSPFTVCVSFFPLTGTLWQKLLEGREAKVGQLLPTVQSIHSKKSMGAGVALSSGVGACGSDSHLSAPGSRELGQGLKMGITFKAHPKHSTSASWSIVSKVAQVPKAAPLARSQLLNTREYRGYFRLKQQHGWRKSPRDNKVVCVGTQSLVALGPWLVPRTSREARTPCFACLGADTLLSSFYYRRKHPC